MRRQALYARSRGDVEAERALKLQLAGLATDRGFESPTASEASESEPSPAPVVAPPETGRPAPGPATERKPSERQPLSRNPRALRYWRVQVAMAATALKLANKVARRGVERLIVPRECYRVLQDIHDDVRALAGALEWVRGQHGPAVLLELESAALYRVPGGRQIDDWSCARARRKAALLVLLLMAPHLLPRSAVTGSPSTELVLVTAGVNQMLLLRMLRSGQREEYSLRTLQRDLKEICECTTLLLRWRTPVAHAQQWERSGQKHGTMNRYCVRAGMVRERWRRAKDGTEALVKNTVLSFATWLVWRPAPARGERVPLVLGEPEPDS